MLKEFFTKNSSMEAKLIRKYDEYIKRDKKALENDIEFLQSLYNAFKNIGRTVSLDRMIHLHSTIRFNPESRIIEDYIKDKILAIASEKTTFNGIPLILEKIKGLIEVPDTSAIKEVFNQYQHFLGQYAAGVHSEHIIDKNLIQIKDGIVLKTDDADTKIEAKHSHYTQNDKGVQMFDTLTNLCDSLNTLNILIAHNNYYYEVNGIEQDHYNKYQPNLRFIRDFENRP